MASDDPEFATKAADVIGLYLKPPQHAAVFCVDEKTAIQALDRLDPVLPFSPGRLERHGFEYRRHGTLSLYAALDTKTGNVLGRTAERHTSEEFVAFLGDLIASQPEGREIHVILDNLSAHKSKRVQWLWLCLEIRGAQVFCYLQGLPQTKLMPRYSSTSLQRLGSFKFWVLSTSVSFFQMSFIISSSSSLLLVEVLLALPPCVPSTVNQSERHWTLSVASS